MSTYKALVQPRTKVFFRANCDTEAKCIAKRIGAAKLIKKVSPTRMEFVS